jgi:hypothetical protein
MGLIHLTPRPANDTTPLGGCDSCNGTDHDSSAHRDPQVALGMAVRHLARHDEIAIDVTKHGDPDKSKRKTAIHHLNMHAMWRQVAETLMARAARRAGGG